MDNQTIESIASRWLVRREAEGWTQADQAELSVWLEESTLHKVAFIRLDTVWQQTARLKALGAGVPQGMVPSQDYWNETGTTASAAMAQDAGQTPARRGRWYAAASVALALLAGSYFFLTQSQGQIRYATPVGGLETLALPDGSRVILNTNTTIRVRLLGEQRRIDLESGEAYFSIAKDPARPFVVRVSNRTVTALGTEFSVRRIADELQLVVTEGRVQLNSGAPLPSGTVTRTLGSEVLTNRASAAQMEELLSWRDGFVEFRDTTLSDAVAELNRYNARKILIADSSIASVRISGKFRSANTEAFLWLLQRGFPVMVEEQKEDVVLRRRLQRPMS